VTARSVADVLAGMSAGKTPVVVIGAGGHAAEVCSHLNDIAAASGPLQLLGCIDDHKPVGRFGPVDVLGGFEFLEEWIARRDDAVHCITAVGDNATRQQLVARVNVLARERVVWTTVQHPSATVGHDVEIGAGTCLAPGSIVTTRVRLGPHSILNVKASVSHDAVVGSYVNLNPNVTVAGNTRIGEGCYIGAGATIIDRMKIGDWTTVGAGAVVIRDLPSRVTAVGVPARIIKRH
jgi:sugar O-acyltransferase (sialic acid O-acetyltransferase NeuD family)